MRKKIIKEDEIEIYAYGAELLLSSVINLLLIIGAAFIVGPLWAAPLIICPFILIRRTSGGYHAKTHLGCTVCLLTSYICGITVVKQIPAEWLFLCLQALLSFSALVVLLIGCVAHKNRPVSREEAVKFKKQSVYTITALYIAGLLGVCFVPGVFAYYVLGVFIAAASLFAAWIINILQKGEDS